MQETFFSDSLETKLHARHSGKSSEQQRLAVKPATEIQTKAIVKKLAPQTYYIFKKSNKKHLKLLDALVK